MDRDSITRTGARAPGVERQSRSNGGARPSPALSASIGKSAWTTGCGKGGSKLPSRVGMPGAGLTTPLCGKAPSDRPALKPYWGKPAVRNFRGGDGNVGIIRSPVRAIALPDKSPCPDLERARGRRRPRATRQRPFPYHRSLPLCHLRQPITLGARCGANSSFPAPCWPLPTSLRAGDAGRRHRDPRRLQHARLRTAASPSGSPHPGRARKA